MGTTGALSQLVENPRIDKLAEPVSRAVRTAYNEAGPAGERVKSVLHGHDWLGHPLHPVFADIVVGAWTTAMALDVAGRNDPALRRAATFAMGAGLVGSAGAAISGLTDWSETDGDARREGLIHGLMNVAATSLMATAFFRRQGGSHENGSACAWTGLAIAVAAAWLGGDLVYRQGVGAHHGTPSTQHRARST